MLPMGAFCRSCDTRQKTHHHLTSLSTFLGQECGAQAASDLMSEVGNLPPFTGSFNPACLFLVAFALTATDKKHRHLARKLHALIARALEVAW